MFLKFRQISSENYLQIASKMLFITKWRPTIMFIIFWDFLVFDQVFLSFKFSYLVLFFTWKLEFVSNILWMIATCNFVNGQKLKGFIN